MLRIQLEKVRSFFKSKNIDKILGQEKYDYITKRLIPSVLMHLEKTYEVYDRLGIDVSAFDACGPIEMKHLAGPYQAHVLAVFGYEFQEGADHIAYAAPCIIKRSNSRPAVGYTVINIR